MPYIPIVTNVVVLGNMAVDIFLVLSGMSLAISAEKHSYLTKGWKDYYGRRLRRILIPYCIIAGPYYLWNGITEHSGNILYRLAIAFINFSSASFWLKGTQTTWFVFAILVLYAMFPTIFRFVKRSSGRNVAVLLACMTVFAVLTAYIPIMKNSMIVWARIPIFTIGVILGVNRNRKFRYGKAQLFAATVLLILLGFVISVSEIYRTIPLPQVYRLLLYMPMTLAVIMLMTNIPEIKRKNGVFAWMGGISLEMYLIHITLLHPIKYYGLMDVVGYWLYLILPAVTILLSGVVGLIEKRLMSYSK